MITYWRAHSPVTYNSLSVIAESSKGLKKYSCVVWHPCTQVRYEFQQVWTRWKSSQSCDRKCFPHGSSHLCRAYFNLILSLWESDLKINAFSSSSTDYRKIAMHFPTLLFKCCLPAVMKKEPDSQSNNRPLSVAESIYIECPMKTSVASQLINLF